MRGYRVRPASLSMTFPIATSSLDESNLGLTRNPPTARESMIVSTSGSGLADWESTFRTALTQMESEGVLGTRKGLSRGRRDDLVMGDPVVVGVVLLAAGAGDNTPVGDGEGDSEGA